MSSKWVASGTDFDIVEVEHSVEALTELFKTAKVVVNVTGPFATLGMAVVEACYNANCHYVDTTGEQDFMFEAKEAFGEKYAQKDLCLMPSVAFIWGPGFLAADLCLEDPEIDTVKTFYAPPTLQTVASLQSFLRMFRRRSHRIVNHKLVLNNPKLRHIIVPGTNESCSAASLGSSETTFYIDNPQVRNCETLFVHEQFQVMTGPLRWARRFDRWFNEKRVDGFIDRMVLRYKKDPPPESTEHSHYVAGCFAEGKGVRSSTIVYGVGPYITTGFICALTAEKLVAGEQRKVGYTSMGQAFGAKNMLDALGEVGANYVTERVSNQPAAGAKAKAETAQSKPAAKKTETDDQPRRSGAVSRPPVEEQPSL